MTTSSHRGDAVGLGETTPARSRHTGRRSAVALTDDAVVAGTADGNVRAFDRETLAPLWTADAGGNENESQGAVVGATPVPGGIAVGERGPRGEVRVHDRESGAVRWRYRTADDVGDPAGDSRFEQPFVASLTGRNGRLYAAARRYERRGDDRAFSSVVYAFDRDGTVAWTYGTDASPVSLDARDDRVAVAYNRCPGAHRAGLVVLDARTGRPRARWDPAGEGRRRVGDVSLLADGAAVTSHADYRGYRLDLPDDDAGRPGTGTVRWRADLATPETVGDETVYAYPNHVHATDAGVVFVTGNTYPEAGRSTESLHPDAHTAVGYAPDGERAWSASVGGFANGLGTDGDRLAVPGAQRFRTRDPATHGVGVFDVESGPRASVGTDGVATAAALDAGALAVVEEPVVYHDDRRRRGEYRLHTRSA